MLLHKVEGRQYRSSDQSHDRGTDANSAIRESQLEQGMEMLTKPFDFPDLIGKVRGTIQPPSRLSYSLSHNVPASVTA